MTSRLLRIRIEDIRSKASQRPDGYVDEVLSLAKERSETHIWMTSDDYDAMADKYSTQAKVGTELKKLVSWFAWAVGATDCETCANREQAMNRWGPDGCEQRLDRIKRWLKHSAASHGIIYSPTIATQLVKQAIANARAKHGKAS